MRGNAFICAVALVGLFVLGGCSFQPQDFGQATVMRTTAATRLVYATPSVVGKDGRVHPIICAEPSPDVVRAVSNALAAHASADLQGVKALAPTGDIKAALDFSRAQSESIAELGKRLATIQLLRDGLYRACEAYANGAITKMDYALLLSRYGDTMVTLLAIEMVSGDAAPPAVLTATSTAGGQAANSDPAGAPANATSPSPQVSAYGHVSPPSSQARSAVSAAQINAVVTLQRQYLRGSDYAPLIVACATAMNRKSALETSPYDGASARSSVRPGVLMPTEPVARKASGTTLSGDCKTKIMPVILQLIRSARRD